jgi:hypothetical protein
LWVLVFGLDPSPKAWEAILLGTIPIIQYSTLDDAYERFPVVFVNEWNEIFQNDNVETFLRSQLTRLAPYYDIVSEIINKILEFYFYFSFVFFSFLFLLSLEVEDKLLG